MNTITKPTRRAVSDADHHGQTHRAKCPKCGKIGTRSLATTRRCWIFRHAGVPSFIPGVMQGVECYVPCHADGSYVLTDAKATR